MSKSATDAGTVRMLSSTTCRDREGKIALSAAACELSNLSFTTVVTLVLVLVLDVCRRCLINLTGKDKKRIWILFVFFWRTSSRIHWCFKALNLGKSVWTLTLDSSQKLFVLTERKVEIQRTVWSVPLLSMDAEEHNRHGCVHF